MAIAKFKPFVSSKTQGQEDLDFLAAAQVGQEALVIIDRTVFCGPINTFEVVLVKVTRVTTSLVCVDLNGNAARFRRTSRKAGLGFAEGRIHALTTETYDYLHAFMGEFRRTKLVDRIRQTAFKLNPEQAEALLEVLRVVLSIAEPSNEGIQRVLAERIQARQAAQSLREFSDATT